MRTPPLPLPWAVLNSGVCEVGTRKQKNKKPPLASSGKPDFFFFLLGWMWRTLPYGDDWRRPKGKTGLSGKLPSLTLELRGVTLVWFDLVWRGGTLKSPLSKKKKKKHGVLTWGSKGKAGESLHLPPTLAGLLCFC